MRAQDAAASLTLGEAYELLRRLHDAESLPDDDAAAGVVADAEDDDDERAVAVVVHCAAR